MPCGDVPAGLPHKPCPCVISESTTVNAPAIRMFPDSTASKIAIAAVCVRHGMSPAIISVAPKSPSDRANAITAAATMARRAKGSVTRQNSRHSPAPSDRAALAYTGSADSKPARADLTSSGIA